MTETTRSAAGLILVLVPTIAYGGATLLRFIGRRTPGYLDNTVRRALFRAGHAHAGVLVLLALVGLLYLDHADLSRSPATFARLCLIAAPILMPAGFFLSVARPTDERPNRLIALVYVGAAALVAGVVVLGLGLLR